MTKTKLTRLPMRVLVTGFSAAATSLAFGAQASAAQVYLNKNTPITVSVGAETSKGDSNNTYDGSQTIQKVIDASSASATDCTIQDTHIWYSFEQDTGGLELLFDFQQAYDISTLHFRNYNGESYDVDQIAFTFFDASHVQVGALTVNPTPGTLDTAGRIEAQNINLDAPLNVRFVTAFLTGSNGEVDFQNLGFTAKVSAVPEPATWAMMILGFGAVGYQARRQKRVLARATA